MIVFCPEQIEMIYEDAISRYPDECCGILLGEAVGNGSRYVKRVLKAKNAADEKRRKGHFVIRTDAVLYAELLAAKSGHEIIGFYHSHTDCGAVASEEDRRFAIPGISYPILSIRDGRVSELTSWEKVRVDGRESFTEETVEIEDADREYAELKQHIPVQHTEAYLDA